MSDLDRWRQIAIPGLPGYFASEDGHIYSERRGSRKLLKEHVRSGYLQVPIQIDGKTRNQRVHRLVLLAFVGPCPQGMQCLHYPNGNNDNSLSNLRWGTQAENEEDKAKQGKCPRGSQKFTAKLTEEQVIEIRRRWSQGESQTKLRHIFGVSSGTISDACTGKLWKHVVADPEKRANGVCPCCHRSFLNVQRHMKSQHPEKRGEGG